MPDPTAHADDMKSPAIIKPDEMPAFWWINPWGYALNLKRALHAVHLLGETTADAYEAAKTVIKQKEEWADYRGKQHNDFQREVEVTLKPACPHLYEDTIGYVQWAADEIKRLRASLSVITEDRDAYVERVKAHCLYADSISSSSETLLAERDAEIAELYKRIKSYCVYGDARDKYAALARSALGHSHSPNQKPKPKPKPKAKRKPAKKKGGRK